MSLGGYEMGNSQSEGDGLHWSVGMCGQRKNSQGKYPQMDVRSHSHSEAQEVLPEVQVTE